MTRSPDRAVGPRDKLFQAIAKSWQIQPSRPRESPRQSKKNCLDFLGFSWISFAELSLFNRFQRPWAKFFLSPSLSHPLAFRPGDRSFGIGKTTITVSGFRKDISRQPPPSGPISFHARREVGDLGRSGSFDHRPPNTTRLLTA
jgi:hypothetical protein